MNSNQKISAPFKSGNYTYRLVIKMHKSLVNPNKEYEVVCIEWDFHDNGNWIQVRSWSLNSFRRYLNFAISFTWTVSVPSEIWDSLGICE